MATTPTLLEGSQYHRDWGVFATANVLPNAPGNALGAPIFPKLAQGQTAFVANTGQWAVLAAPGTSGGGNATWLLFNAGVAANNFVQSAVAQLAANASTSSGAFVNLLTINMVTGNGFINSIFTSASENSSFFGAQNDFALFIDGVQQHATSCFVGGLGVTQSCSICDRDAIAAGAHTFDVRWKTNAGTASIAAAGAGAIEHANLVIWETKT